MVQRQKPDTLQDTGYKLARAPLSCPRAHVDLDACDGADPSLHPLRTESDRDLEVHLFGDEVIQLRSREREGLRELLHCWIHERGPGRGRERERLFFGERNMAMEMDVAMEDMREKMIYSRGR